MNATIACTENQTDTAPDNGMTIEAQGSEPFNRLDEALSFPMSGPQLAIWLSCSADPDSPTYNIVYTTQLPDSVDSDRIRSAAQSLMDRHSMLRATFGLDPSSGQPLQTVHPCMQPDYAELDLTQTPPDTQDARIADIAREPFDLRRGPPIRFRSLRRSPSETTLLTVIHHLAADGWCARLLVKDFIALLTDCTFSSRTRTYRTASYQEFVDVERTFLASEDAQRDLAYWRRQLGHALSPLALLSKTSTAPLSQKGQSFQFGIPDGLFGRLQSLSRALDCTPFEIAFSAFATLLHRYTQRPDIVVAAPVLNRRGTRFLKVVGCFVNMVLLRLDLGDDPAFLSLIPRSQDAVRGAVAHERVPLAHVLETLRRPGEPSFVPDLSLGWVKLQGPVQRPRAGSRPRIGDCSSDSASPCLGTRLPPLTFDLPVQQVGAPFDLNLTFYHQGDSCAAELRYRAGRFDRPSMERFALNLLTLIESIVIDPSVRLSQLAFVAPDELATLHRWAKQSAEPRPPSALSLPDLIHAQCATHPSRIAVRSADTALTYAELDQQSDEIAARLTKLGVRSGSLVALVFERTASAIIAMMAVHKSGAAYLPLDPNHPSERIRSILDDAGVAAVLTQAHLADRLSDAHKKCILFMDDLQDAVPLADSSTLAASPNGLAYVIYTSGSTATPKGVCISHANLSYSNAARTTFYAQHVGRYLLLSPFAFDSSVAGIFWTLSTGGTLVVPDDTSANDPIAICAMIAHHEITHLLTLPALYALVLAAATDRQLDSLRTVVVAGEACPCHLIAEHQKRLPNARIYNEYGPTEATVWATVQGFGMTQDGPKSSGVACIGSPIPGTLVQIVDGNGLAVPIGVQGECWIGGPGVAKGYLNRPDLTAERFIETTGDSKGITALARRWYRSGDLCRFREDGALEFCGRIDGQVKIRGQRIEVGEIEATIASYPSVLECAVVFVDDGVGESFLGAHVTLKASVEGPPDARALQTFVASRLPAAMVPTVFEIATGRLPRTATGKLDRKALPAIVRPERSLRSTLSAPRSGNEALVADLWKTILGISDIGVAENFFALGGNSLSAMQVSVRLSQVVGEVVPVHRIFETPTIEGLAQWLTHVQSEASDAGHARALGHNTPRVAHIPRLVGPDETDVEVSLSQERMWFLNQLDPNGVAYSMPVAIRIRGRLDLGMLEQAYFALVKRQKSLRTRFVMSHDGELRQHIDPCTKACWNVVDLSEEIADQREGLALQHVRKEARAPFDLEHGPVARMSVLRLHETDHVVIMNLHHIIGDQWSYAVMLHELSELYRAKGTGSRPELKELPIQYADYSRCQRRGDLPNGSSADDLSYWTQHLAGISPLELPTDRRRPSVQTYRGACRKVTLSKPLLDRVLQVSLRAGATPFMMLLTCFKVLLQRYSGAADIAVAVPVANRTGLDTESLIGVFVNTLVFRTDLSGTPSALDLLRRVRAVTLEAFKHQGTPFEQVVQALQPTRDLSRTPLAQVLFNVANVPLRDRFPSELTWGIYDIDVVGAQFDLSLTLELDASRQATLIYNIDLFDDRTAEALLSEYVYLIEQICAEPEQTIDKLHVLTSEERQEILVDWNQTTAEYLRDATLPQVLLSRAKHNRECVAVRCGERSLTYEQLEERSNALAWHLRENGAGCGDIVGVYLGRSIDLLIAFLGVMKAGACYLPLDPAFPSARLAFYLKDSGAHRLITTSSRKSELEAFEGVRILIDESPVSDAQRKEPPAQVATAMSPVYVLYTSGSTGVPKGVQICHRALVNFLWSMRRTLDVTHADVLLSVTTMSFDIQGLELYLPLISGGQVIIATEEQAIDGQELANLLSTSHATIMQATPATWRLLLHAGWSGNTDHLTVLCGGEPFPPELIEPLQARSRAVWNLYGPTETTIWSTAYYLPQGCAGPVSIGRPIANTQIYILNSVMDPVPVGVAGDLYIGGDGLALGYLHRPELTSERFIPDPFSSAPGAKLYKTGDQARYRRDGTIDFLGRGDGQVKLNGFRIELGEIEVALCAHSGILQAAVLLRQDANGMPHLAAFVCMEDNHLLPAPHQLREALEKRIPHYMVPRSFTPLSAMPLTANGKVDRRALDALPVVAIVSTAESLTARRGPSTAMELRVAAIWTTLLNVPELSVDDNFFAIGGTSLLAGQLMARVNAAFRVQLPLRALFQHPTIASQTRLLVSVLGGAEVQVLGMLFPVQPQGTRPALYLVPGAHERGALQGTFEENLLRYMAQVVPYIGLDQPLYAFRPLGLTYDEVPHTSVAEMALAYVRALRKHQPKGPYRLGGECVGGLVAYEMARQLRAAGEEVDVLLLLDTIRPTLYYAIFESVYYMLLQIRAARNCVYAAFRNRFQGTWSSIGAWCTTLWTVLNALWQTRHFAHAYRYLDYYFLSRMLWYQPKPYDRSVVLVANAAYQRRNAGLGWSNAPIAGLEVIVVPGNHTTRLTQYAELTGPAIRNCLETQKAVTPLSPASRDCIKTP